MKRPRRSHDSIRNIAILYLAFVSINCSTSQDTRNRKVSFPYESTSSSDQRPPLNQAELQEDLLRFDSRFAPRLREASLDLEEHADTKLRYLALKHRLTYISSALDISLGPSPEANLLDMIAFIELSRSALERYWIPKVFGQRGLPLKKAFDVCAEEIWNIASKVLNPHQRKVLESIIQRWIRENPNQIFVEGVRLSQFSYTAGAKAKQNEVGGILASVGRATVAADEAILLGQRALYYAQRAPFLMRLQAQASVQELTEEIGQLSAEPAPFHQTTGNLNSVLLNSQSLLKITQFTLDQLRNFHQEIGSPKAQDLMQAVNQMNHAITQLSQLLTSPQFQNDLRSFGTGTAQLETLSNRMFIKIGILIAFLMTFAGLVIVTSKIAYDRVNFRYRSSHQNKEKPPKKAA